MNSILTSSATGSPGATVLSLDEAPVDVPVVVVPAPEGTSAAHRLATLGWRPGAVVSVIRRTAGGARVVSVGGARVAIGHTLAHRLLVEVPA
ncbi:MAG: ferrous iron transport protein A [Propionibacteriaceae bacterium]|nr:ferrous iron transport protein A [Propionibacteriaceae bacterium]